MDSLKKKVVGALDPIADAMDGFKVPLILEPSEDGGRWIVRKRFNYWFGALGQRTNVDVPAGFVTDLASIPRIIWYWMPPFGRYTKAAVIHDWLYAQQSYSKAMCDAIFLQAMEGLKVPLMRRYLIWLGVRIGGFYAWSQHKKRKAAQRAKPPVE